MTFGERLTALRKAAGMTQETLADKAGIPVGTLRGLEQGLRFPAWATLQRLGKAVGATLGDFDGCELAPEKERAAGKGKRGKGKK